MARYGAPTLAHAVPVRMRCLDRPSAPACGVGSRGEISKALYLAMWDHGDSPFGAWQPWRPWAIMRGHAIPLFAVRLCHPGFPFPCLPSGFATRLSCLPPGFATRLSCFAIRLFRFATRLSCFVFATRLSCFCHPAFLRAVRLVLCRRPAFELFNLRNLGLVGPQIVGL